MYFGSIDLHSLQWKNVQRRVIQKVQWGNSDPSAEQPLMQIYYWPTESPSWKGNITLALELEYNMKNGWQKWVKVFHNIFLSVPPELHRQRPTDRHSYKSSYGEYGHNSGPEQGESIDWDVSLVTLPPGLVDEILHMLENKRETQNVHTSDGIKWLMFDF